MSLWTSLHVQKLCFSVFDCNKQHRSCSTEPAGMFSGSKPAKNHDFFVSLCFFQTASDWLRDQEGQYELKCEAARNFLKQYAVVLKTNKPGGNSAFVGDCFQWRMNPHLVPYWVCRRVSCIRLRFSWFVSAKWRTDNTRGGLCLFCFVFLWTDPLNDELV